MAQTSPRSWMWNHRQTFGDKPVRDLCLPSSHDAGTYRLLFGTTMGTESNVLTQKKTIFEQLELGVRYFDIRPMYSRPNGSHDNFTWNCGHYTGEAYDRIGWQGGSCAPIQEVVDDVNRFTKDNSELIILDVSHVDCMNINNPISSNRRDLTDSEWKSLFVLFSGIENRFTLERAGGNKDRPIQDYLLNDFIRNNRPAVVVIVDYGGTRDDLYQNGIWPTKTVSGQNTFGANGTSVTRMQGTADAVFSTFKSFLGPTLNSDSVLSLAERKQELELPWLLQSVATASTAADLPSSVTLDRIENADLLTLCLAIAYQRSYDNRGIRDKVVVYGDALVTHEDAHRDIQAAIDAGRSWRPDNESLRGDPWFGMRKSCAVFYRQDGLLKGRLAREGGLLHFELDVWGVRYGGIEIRHQRVYLRLLRAIAEREGFIVSNNNLGGDPRPGVHKDFSMQWRDMNDTTTREAESEESHYIDFETWWEKLGKSSRQSHMWR